MVTPDRLFARALLVVLAVGAVTQNVSSQTSRTRDSSGVRIVENSSRLGAPVVFTLGIKPNVDIGGLDDDPDKELSAKVGYPRALRLSDGRVVVTDRNRVQYFDRTGKRLRITGREGGGPGEFTNVTSTCRIRGDSVLVSDGSQRRMTVLSESGEFLSVNALPLNNYSEREFCLNDGTFISVQILPTDRGGDGMLRISHANRAGSILNAITDLNTGVFDPVVLRESSYTGWGANVVLGTARDYDVLVYSASGKLSTIIRTNDKLQTVTQSELEKLPSMGYRAGATAAERRADAQRMIALSRTKTWPTYGRLMPDLSGRLWIQDWRQASFMPEPEGWTAFDATGKMIGRLIIPAAASKEQRKQVVHFGKDEVFIRQNDDDGAIHYIAYPILPKK